ncbi:hypothetical protein EV183_005310 [Coemansia sp. RSA 2336]|nr:hypothetical protein EV183_005310 [Coemansia sp. RSA 2336]
MRRYFWLALYALQHTGMGDTYHKSPCNAVHWTHMLEGKIIVEGRDRKPMDVENLFYYEHDLPPNHRIIHTYDDESTQSRPDRLTIYVDRENIFLNAFCIAPSSASPKSSAVALRKKQKMEPDAMDDGDSNAPSPMHISTPTGPASTAADTAAATGSIDDTAASTVEMTDPEPQRPEPRTLLDSDPIRINLIVDIEDAPEHLQQGLRQIVESHNVPYFYRPGRTSDAVQYRWHMQFVHSSDVASGSFEVRNSLGQVRVLYNRTIDAFRALGQVLTAARAAEVAAANSGSDLALEAPEFTISEQAQFETLALMIDCSRNGVLGVKSVQAMLRNMALMGYTMLQLYTEDTYKVDGEPFFGYLRGGYTQAELRAIDDYAFAMGVEVVPCIQTLGHLGQMLQWPQYAGLRDTSEVILSRLPETYKLLEKLIATVSAPLRSKRIHIGMDEAYGVGEGRFRQMFGAQEGTAIFVEHLARVHAICEQHGLRAMIWSDMLFCLAAKNNALYAYYDQSNNPAEALSRVEGIPPDIDLVFWDYYHTLPEIYARKIQQHRELGCENPWMAGGAWTWSRLWCYLPFSFESNRASLTAAKSPAGRVSSFMLTIWGDEGNECDFFSALPVMMYVANHAHTPMSEIAVDFMENSFAAICGGSLVDWMLASRIDEIPQAVDADIHSQLPSNMSKWLLWEDPMLSFMSPQYATLDLDSHYTNLAGRLLECALAVHAPGAPARYPLNRLLRLPGLLSRVLSLKCHLRDRLAVPYKAGDRAALLQVAETRLRPLIEAQRELWLYHRARWHRIYKPFGWETLELRYGGLTARLETMYDRIVSYALQQPCSQLRRSRGIGVAAGISRHPALLPARSRHPSKVLEEPLSSSSAMDTTGSLPVAPGPSMMADETSGMSIGEAPAWLPAITSMAVTSAATTAADIAGEPVAATTIGLGWPVTTVSIPACGPQPPTTADVMSIVSCGATTAAAAPAAAIAAEPQANPVMTALPGPSLASHQNGGGDAMSLNSGNITTINALGVRELGGEGDFWLQPAPLLPPELDPVEGMPAGIGSLGEEDDEVVESIPELEEDLQCIYENAYTSLLLDYGRVTAPSRLG